MSLPSKLYRLHLLPTEGKRLSYGQKGGGTFSDLGTMQWRLRQLERDGIDYEIYWANIEWVKIEDPHSVLGDLPSW